MLFPNMDSEMLCLFLFESSEEIFERPKKLVWTEIVFVHFHYLDPKTTVETSFHIPDCRANAVLQNSLFEFLFIFL